VEVLSDNYHQAPIEGIGIVNEKATYFIPTEVAAGSNVFKTWANDASKKKIVFDVKKVFVALLHKEIYLTGVTFDMFLASYLLNPAESHHNIPAIANREGKKNVLFDEEVYGKGTKLKVPEQNELADHVIRKTKLLYELKDNIEEQLKENEQFDLFEDLELPLASILAEMEHIGVQVDVNRLKEMGTELKARLSSIEEEVFQLAGEEFNLNSPKQLGVILFEKLGLPVIKKTKTGYSTAAAVLEKLEDKHEIIPKILLYRQLAKLQSTYIEGLLKVVNKNTNKVHTRYNQALTQTGRLSSEDPNLQNIPIRLEEGRKIRQAFIPSKKD